MRALWVAAAAPDHEGGGGTIRQAHLLGALAGAVPTDVVVAGALGSGMPAGVATVTAVPVPPAPRQDGGVRRRLHDLARMVPSDRPPDVADDVHLRRALAAAVGDLASQSDIVHVETHTLADLRDDVAGAGAAWSVAFQYLPSTMAAHASAIATTRRERTLWRRAESQGRRFEARVAAAYDVAITVSDEDARRLPGSVVVPNGVDLGRFTPAPLPDEPRIVMTGTLDFRPNVDGATWFVAEVLPLVRAEVPAAAVSIVGRSPVAEVVALGRVPGVEVVADAPSIVPHLASARVAVVPIRLGSGTRLKALEALAAGRPVVGTSVGLDGLGLQPGRDAWFADDPAAMASAVVRLLVDEGAARATAAAGRAVAESRFSWNAIGAAFVDHLLDAARRRR